MAAIFTNGQCLVVTTRGVGNLHLLTYQGNADDPDVVGSTPTTNTGVTRFLVSHSYNYQKYAFFWDGAGEAVYGIGTGLQRQPVGRSWSQASAVSWGATTVTTIDVSITVKAAVDRTGATTCFVIPDKI
jgi:hypothetical protein